MKLASAVLIAAMGDVLHGKGVLFLTPDRKSTDEIVKNALRMAASQIALVMNVTLRDAEGLFKEATSPWHIEVSDKRGGWVFFFPASEIGPTEDVNNPDLVYFPDGDDYVCDTYAHWKRRGVRATPKPNRPRTVWDHLRDED